MQEIAQAESAYKRSLADQPADPGLRYCTGSGAFLNDMLQENAGYISDSYTIVIMRGMLGLPEEKKEDADYRTFFESCARIRQEIITWEGEYYFLLQDPHPPTYLRVNTVVQQFPQFNETYGIKEGDGKWIKPEDRVPVW